MTNVTPMQNVQVKTLADKALLVRLSRKSISTSVRDKALEGNVRSSTGDDSITVSKHLFKSKDSLVRKLIIAFGEVYRLHIENTMPWIDRGPRLLPSRNYFEYMETMRRAIEQVDQMVPTVVRNWDQLVIEDVQRRGGTASPDDYPSIYKVREAFHIDLQPLPLPDTGDFRIDVDDATRESLQNALQEAEQVARADIIKGMLEPVEKAVEKLSTPIGAEGSVFRDSLVGNLFNGIHRARTLNISDDPDLEQAIEEIEARVRAVADPQALGQLRENQAQRDHAAQSLSEIMDKLGQL